MGATQQAYLNVDTVILAVAYISSSIAQVWDLKGLELCEAIGGTEL